MDIEEKYNLAIDIAQKWGVDNNKENVISIAEGIKNDRFLVEYHAGKVVIFFTWEDSLIDHKRYIFIKDLWIEPEYRKSSTLLRLRKIMRLLLPEVYRYYWFDRKKQKMVYRR